MTLLRTGMDLDQDTIDRTIVALRLGLYRAATLPDGVRAVDHHHATQRLVCDVTRASDGSRLPFIDMRAGTRAWTDVSTLAPGGDELDVRNAFVRSHADLAVIALSAPVMDDGLRKRIEEALRAIAIVTDVPTALGWVVVAQAATPWTPLTVGRMPRRCGPSPYLPDPELARHVPQAVLVRIADNQGDDRRTIFIDSIQGVVSASDAPDAMDAMRTLTRLSELGLQDGRDRGNQT
jgi:hypothetical protein